mgnify:FL=1
MIITIILSLLSCILEGVISNLLINMNLYFIIIVISISSLFIEKSKYLYIIFIIIGIIYDCIYFNTILHTFIFPFLLFISYNMKNKRNIFYAFFNYIILNISYIIIFYFFTMPYNNISFSYIFNIKIINIIYFLLVYVIYFIISLIKRNSYNKKNI